MRLVKAAHEREYPPSTVKPRVRRLSASTSTDVDGRRAARAQQTRRWLRDCMGNRRAGGPLLAFVLCASLTGNSPAFAQNQASRTRDDGQYSIVHDDALRRAKVWVAPTTPIEKAKLGENPGGRDRFAPDDIVSCRFKPGGVAGSTPKFDCELKSGEKVKIKYGRDNAEVYAEVAATRLLAALGVPADRMYVVDRVRCYGCPVDPFAGLQCVNEGVSIADCFPDLDYTTYQEFESAVIERPVEGRRIETMKERGWAWNELAKIDATAGGASRANVDALRLLAVFLNHWDNKAKNQRLLCLGENDPPGRVLDPRPCGRPLAMIQDLGATFGPNKLDLLNWAASPIWADAATCAVSMRALPYGGSTFPDTRITEEGRRFLAERLGRLSPRQIRELFEGARVSRYPHKDPQGANVDNWVHAFQAKVRMIRDRAPCPAEAPAFDLHRANPSPLWRASDELSP